MPFRYQLQKVMNLKEKEQKALDAEVMEKKALRDIELDKLNELETRRTAAQKGLNAQMSAGATSDVAASNDYIQLLNLRVEAQKKMLKEAEHKLAEATERQMEVRRFVQKLEKHKDMKLQQWMVQEKKKEAQRIDEMAGTIFMKKRAADAEALIEEQERLERLEKLRLLRELRDRR